MSDINSNLPVQDSTDGTIGASSPSLAQQAGGKDGSGNLQALKVDTSGRLLVNLNDSSGVGLTSTTVSAKQALDTNITNATLAITQSGTWTTGRTWTLSNSTDSIAAVQSGTWNINNISGTVSLPTGASTASKQDTGNTSLASIDSKVPSNLTVTSTRLLVDGSGVTQPVSGTITANQGGTWNINNVSGTVSLPTGASSASNQTNGSQKTQVVDGSGTVIGPAQTISGTTYMPVVLAASATSGSAVAARSIQIAGSDGTNARTLTTNTSGNLLIAGNVASGAADSGNPIKTGGVYNSTLPVVSSGQRVDLQLDSSGRVIISPTITTPPTSATFSSSLSISPGVTNYTSYTASQKLALKQFYAGGVGIGKQTLYSYGSATTTFVNAGDFESASNFGTSTNTNKWFWTSGGTGSIAQSNTQVFSGSFSAQLTFSNSSGANAQSIKQNFTSAVDYSGWRYLSAQFYNTLSTGAAYTRTISIVLTDTAANTRTYSVSGASTASPFNSSGWIQILGELANPTSSSGTSFDATQIASITLTMSDSGNKSGIVYWDTVKLTGSLASIFPIFHAANQSFNIPIDPVFIVNIGDQLLIAQTNNDTIRKEYFAFAGGVLL